MSISTEMVLMVVGAAASVTTAIFWGAWNLGRLGNKLDWLGTRVEEHERILSVLGRRLNDPVPPGVKDAHQHP